MPVTANFAADRQSYRLTNGEEWEFHVKVNFDEVVRAMWTRARKSKHGKATSLGGAVVVQARKTRDADESEGGDK